MTAAAYLLAATILGLLWLRSGHDPLYWLVRSVVLLRAVLTQAGAEFWRGCRRWWRAMPAAIARHSRECLGGHAVAAQAPGAWTVERRIGAISGKVASAEES